MAFYTDKNIYPASGFSDRIIMGRAAGIWSCHNRYGIYNQSGRYRGTFPQDVMLAMTAGNEYPEGQSEYLKSLYPKRVQIIQHEVEKCCDAFDYGGSFIYDEYPDRISLGRMEKQILNELKDNNELKNTEEQIYEIKENAVCPICPQEPPGPPPRPMPEPPKPHEESWIESVIRILLYQEIGERRNKRRKREEKWF